MVNQIEYTCPPDGFASCAEKNGTTGDPNCAHCRATRATAMHPWQEYNAHGNTCHYPGCRMTEDEHAQLERAADIEVTTFADLARGERVYLRPDGTTRAEPINAEARAMIAAVLPHLTG